MKSSEPSEKPPGQDHGRGADLSSRGKDTEGKQVVVQCPSCDTRFALDAAMLSAKESPKFHCSRCDNIFSLSDGTGERVIDVAVKGPPSRTSLPEETSFQFSSAELSAAPEFSAQNQIEFPFPKGMPRTGEPDIASFAAPIFRSEVPHGEPAEEQMTFDMAHESASALMRVAPRTSEWQGFYVFCAPVMVFLTLLVGTSFYIRTDPRFAQKFSSIFFLPQIQVPPPGLFIEELRFRTVSLDSGESIGVISGTLVNDTAQTFSRVAVEGVAFDTTGRHVASQVVDAGSSLSKARVKSLTVDMIDHLQNNKRKEKALNLAPGKRHEFSIALSAEIAGTGRHYSARVYSVEG